MVKKTTKTEVAIDFGTNNLAITMWNYLQKLNEGIFRMCYSYSRQSLSLIEFA